MTAVSMLETLLLVQGQDLALDRLRHRRATLPDRASLETWIAERDVSARAIVGVRAERDRVHADERRLDDEAQAIGAKAADVDHKLYSGTVSSPRELQAMQADLDMLKRQRRELEDRELEVMEQRETLDAQLEAFGAEIARLDTEITGLRSAIADEEAEIDVEIASEEATRAGYAADIPVTLLADYEKRRVQNRGAGAARLVGTTCQACHLSVPSTEAERIRRGGGEEFAYCDNCGAILVP
ncbi:MAG: zinc ribbon domain-containing protein [Actinomycetota bacterium]